MNFFSVEVLTLTGLVRCLVPFVIDLQTRRVQIGGVCRGLLGSELRRDIGFQVVSPRAST